MKDLSAVLDVYLTDTQIKKKRSQISDMAESLNLTDKERGVYVARVSLGENPFKVIQWIVSKRL